MVTAEREVLHVLQVEDSESDAALVVRSLARAGYDVRWQRVEDARSMREALERQPWDLILADYRLPGFDAPGALAVLRETGRDIPFIVVSATIGEDRAVAMMKSGAHDYIIKDNLARLAPAVEREIREARSRHERAHLEQQFLQAQKLESIGRLAGGVAHDFNNLLTVITGYSDMALGKLPPGDALRGPLEEISKAAARAAGLTRQLLTFSRRQVSVPATIELNTVVRDVEKMLARLIGEEIDLTFSLDPGLGTIRADPGQVEQVVMNLAVNAKDAMPNGGRLLVETSRFQVDAHFRQSHLPVEPGEYVMLSVSDNGVGMTAEVKEHIFEPFFTTKELGKGTGLGLSTVYGIVKQSGGSIWVYSEPGRGTTFRMLFPVVEPDREVRAALPETATQAGTETVLVAEDEPAVRKYVREVLTAQGYRVLEAANGREAMQVVQEHAGSIDLLLADSVMPELGGAQLAEQFSAQRPGVPILIASGYSDRQLPDAAARNFIQKPFMPSALLTKVRALLDSTARQPA